MFLPHEPRIMSLENHGVGLVIAYSHLGQGMRGKSGLQMAGWLGNAQAEQSDMSATENIPPKAEIVKNSLPWVRVKW